MEPEKTGWEIKVEGLTVEQARALQEKVKCAVVLQLPERFRLEQIFVQPKVDDKAT